MGLGTGCSLVFGESAGQPDAGQADAGQADARVVDASGDAGPVTPRIPASEQFADCGGEPLPGFGKRTQIAIDYNAIEILDGYPLLVPIPADVLQSLSLEPSGADLRFAAGNGAILPYEVEHWNPAGTSYVWVRVELRSVPCNQRIWMYSDNPNAIPPGPAFAEATWSGAMGIWHFASDGDVQKNSASGSEFSATISSGVSALPIEGDSEEVMGRAQRNGKFQVDIGAGIPVPNESTWEARFRTTDPEIVSQRPLSFHNVIALIATRALGAENFKNPAIAITQANEVPIFLQVQTDIDTNWHYMALTIKEGPEKLEATLYFDGQEVSQEPGTITAFADYIAIDATPFKIGLRLGDTDEVRVTPQALPQEWIEMNQRAFDGQAIQFATTDPVP